MKLWFVSNNILLILCKEYTYTSQMDKSRGSGSLFVKTHVCSAKLFELQEEAFNEMVFLVKPSIDLPGFSRIGFRRNTVLSAMFDNIFSELLGIISLIRHWVPLRNQRLARRDELYIDLTCKRCRLSGGQSRFLQVKDG